jgi:hypothetical protein
MEHLFGDEKRGTATTISRNLPWSKTDDAIADTTIIAQNVNRVLELLAPPRCPCKHIQTFVWSLTLAFKKELDSRDLYRSINSRRKQEYNLPVWIHSEMYAGSALYRSLTYRFACKGAEEILMLPWNDCILGRGCVCKDSAYCLIRKRRFCGERCGRGVFNYRVCEKWVF